MTHPHLDPQRAANLAENPYAGQGPVLLNIGDDVGAIVLHLPAELEGAEIEIQPWDDQGQYAHQEGDHLHDPSQIHDHTHGAVHGHPRYSHRPHVAVIGRPVYGGVDYSAVFPELTSGPYGLTIPAATALLRVEVTGGQVTDVTWPESA